MIAIATIVAIIAIVAAVGAVSILTSISLTQEASAAPLFGPGNCNKFFHFFIKGKTPCTGF